MWIARFFYSICIGLGVYCVACLLGLPDFLNFGQHQMVAASLCFTLVGTFLGVLFEVQIRADAVAKRRERNLRRRGKRVSATVDLVESVGSRSGEFLYFKLVLSTAEQTFESAKLGIEHLHVPRIQPGCIVTVYHNPRDPRDFIVALEESPPRSA
jgi:hypothetical protein